MASFRIGKYKAKSYAHGWDLGEVRVLESGPSAGQERLANTTHHATLEAAINAIMRRRLRESDAEGLAEILQEIQDFRAELAKQFTIRIEVEE